MIGEEIVFDLFLSLEKTEPYCNISLMINRIEATENVCIYQIKYSESQRLYSYGETDKDDYIFADCTKIEEFFLNKRGLATNLVERVKLIIDNLKDDKNRGRIGEYNICETSMTDILSAINMTVDDFNEYMNEFGDTRPGRYRL